MAEESKSKSKAPEANEYGQTEEQFKEAHGGKTPDEVNPPSEPFDEKQQEERAKARWG